MHNNRKVMATYHSFAQAEALDDRGGRFAILDKPAVTGSSPTPTYPQMPAGSPWANEPIGPEPLIDGSGEGDRLGYEIDRPDAPLSPQDSGIGNGPTTSDGTSEIRPVVRRSLRRL